MSRSILAATLICGALAPTVASADVRVTCTCTAASVECVSRTLYTAPRREDIAYQILRPAEADPYAAERAANFCGRGYRMTAAGCVLGR